MRYVNWLILISIEFVEKSIYNEEKNAKHRISNTEKASIELDDENSDSPLPLLLLYNNLHFKCSNKETFSSSFVEMIKLSKTILPSIEAERSSRLPKMIDGCIFYIQCREVMLRISMYVPQS
jgi:hypothetical protein